MYMLRRFPVINLALASLAIVGAACSSKESSPRQILDLSSVATGDVIALRPSSTTDDVVEWVDRRAGTIRSMSIDGGSITTLAKIDIGTDGPQRGLLGQAVIDGVRYAAWTDPDDDHLLVGALTPPGDDGAPGVIDRIVWDAGGTKGGAVGGHLEASAGGELILGIGQLTDWAKAHGSGAMLQLDPTGPADQEPVVLSDGYVNPFAFVVDGDRLWVADNAVGDDVEPIGRGDIDDRSGFDRSNLAPRAPSALVSLGDGRLGVCGYLDGQLRSWSTTDPIDYGDSLGPCATGATVLADGTIVTVTADALVAIRP